MKGNDKNILIGKRIKEARKIRGLTLDDVASEVQVAKSTIQRYETGKIELLKIPVLESIARCLDVDNSWLMGADVPMQRSNIQKTADEIYDKVMKNRKHTFWELTDDEEGIITIYRQLDEYGRKAVKSSLNNEYDRVMSQSELIAAHAENQLTEEQKKAIEKFRRNSE